MGAWRIAAALAALAAYAAVSHALMVHWPAQPWTVAALFGPLLAGVALGGWSRRHAPTLVFCALATIAVVVVTARGGVTDVQWLYVLQHGAIHVVLAWTFAITLRPGATPLVSALAERVHTRFTPAMRDYTRRLTAAWAGYFAGMVVLSLAIFALAPWSWWSLYCNVLTPLAVGLVFAADHLWRRWRHPEFEPVSIALAVQAWRRHGAAEAR